MKAIEASPLPETVNGLPLHPLVVHVVVVLIPLAILGAIGISLWPAMRRHLGLLVLAGSVVGLLAVPVATSSGKQFRNHLGAQQLVRQHQHYAHFMLPWTATLVVLLGLTVAVDIARRLGPVMSAVPVSTPSEPGTGGVALATRQQASVTTDPTAAPVTRLERWLGRLLPARLRDATQLLRRSQPVLAVLTIAAALVLAWYCYKTGDSGAKAVWQGR